MQCFDHIVAGSWLFRKHIVESTQEIVREVIVSSRRWSFDDEIRTCTCTAIASWLVVEKARQSKHVFVSLAVKAQRTKSIKEQMRQEWGGVSSDARFEWTIDMYLGT